MYRLTLVMIFAACLSACGISGSDPMAGRSLEQMAEPARQAASQGLQPSSRGAAMAVLPPDAGTIQKVARQTSSEGTRQVIEYDHDVPGLKSNRATIDILMPATSARLEQTVEKTSWRQKPSEAGIQAELASEFPRMQMRVVSTPRSNDYGTYGLAVGQWNNGARCIYAWQWIDPLPSDGSADSGLVASWRIRLCRSDMTLDQMAALVDRLKIDPSRHDSEVQAAVVPPVEPRKHPRKRPATPVAAVAQSVATTANARPFLSLQPQSPSLDAASEPDPTMPAAAYRGPSTIARTGTP
jgi:hypothetical protein